MKRSQTQSANHSRTGSSTLRTFLIFTSSLTAAVVLVVGVPWFLTAMVGWPLPTVIPTLSDVADTFGRGGASDTTVMKTFATVAWVAWLHVMWVFLSELSAALHHSVPTVASSSAFTHRLVRPIVNGLVFTTTTLGAVVNPVMAMASPAAVSPAVVDIELDRYVQRITSMSAVANPIHTLSYDFSEVEGFDLNSRDQADDVLIPYQVRKGDNLWDLAEEHLGDPFRWPELWEQSKGLDQLAGSMRDPNLIHPDWVLLMPSDAVGVPAADAALVQAVLGTPAPDLTTQDLADQVVEEPESETQSMVLEPTDPVAADPADIEPIVPDTAEGEPVVPESTPQIDDLTNGRSNTASTAVVVETELSVTRTAALFGGALATAGILAALMRRRRHAAAYLEPGSVPEEPDAQDTETETKLRETTKTPTTRTSAVTGFGDTPSEALDTEWVWAALSDVEVTEPVLGSPILAKAEPDSMELVFTNPATPTRNCSWVPNTAANNEMWTLSNTQNLVLAQGRSSLVYSMVEIGEGYLLDLETAGILSLDGPTETAEALVRSLVHQLMFNPLSPTLDVRIATPIEGLGELGCRTETNMAALVGEITDWLDTVADLTATGAGVSSFGRRHQPNRCEELIPLIVVAQAAELVAYPDVVAKAKDPAFPLALVVLGDVLDTEYRVEFTKPEQIGVLHPWRLSLHLNQMSVDEAGQAARLLSNATSTASKPVDANRVTPPTPTKDDVAVLGAGHELVEIVEPVLSGPEVFAVAESGIEVSTADEQSADNSEPAATAAVVVGGLGAVGVDWVSTPGSSLAELSDSVGVAGFGEGIDLATQQPPQPVSVSECSVEDGRDGEAADPVERLSIVVNNTNNEADTTVGGGVSESSRLRLTLLGDITMCDTQGKALPPQMLSAATILSVHGTITKEAFINALWNGRATTDARFASMLTGLRTRIGRHRVPESRDGRYYLEGVRSDLADFEDFAEQADLETDPTERVTLLRGALELVVGVPLSRTSKKSWEWLDTDQVLTSKVDCLVLKVAQDLTSLYEAAQDWEGVIWAAGVGNQASPANMAMVINLALAHKRTGNIGIAERQVRAWETLISQLGVGDPDDTPRLLLASA